VKPWPIAFITIHPRFIESYFEFGVFKSAREANIAAVAAVNLRDFSYDKHASIDDKPYGGGDGMVMRADCLAEAVESVFSQWGTRDVAIVYTRPGEKTWDHECAVEFAANPKPTIFVCGRFAGIDERFVESYVTDLFSVGDFVLAGGELACLAMAESALRFVPGVLGHSDSAVLDSFGSGLDGLLEAPLYTRPSEWKGLAVPDVLLSGDHEKIAKWRKKMSVQVTQEKRLDLLSKK
jgi:tRNA (guanine37-N1)-methyltransferase